MTELMRRRRALMAVGGGSPYEHGTWDDLFYCIDNGTYATDYALGEILPLDLGTEGVVNAQIVAFNADDKADGSGKAPITILCQYLLNTSKRYNPALAGTAGNRTVGTGTIGGFAHSELKAYLQSTIKPLIPNAIANRIVLVTKYTVSYDSAETKNMAEASTEELWVPSLREVASTNQNRESDGPVYPIFTDNTSRKRSKHDASPSAWRLRTAHTTSNAFYVGGTGAADVIVVTGAYGVLLGFCIG